MQFLNAWCYSLCYCLLSICVNVSAFNVFPQYSQVFSDKVLGSYFGYSVLLQASVGRNPARVVVGSPRSNTTYDLATLKSLVEPGAVYSCPLTGGQPCKQFLINIKGNEQSVTENRQTYFHKKDHGYLGASIDGLDVANGRLVACSPRWINQYHRDIYYLQNGLCYLMEDSTSEGKTGRILLPLINAVLQGEQRANESVYYYALGEAGMSVHLAKNNTELLFGAPGVLQWRGMIGKYSGDMSERNLNVPNPNHINALQDFAYFGYALSSGKFKKDSDEVWYVGGAPRGRNLMGQVLVYDYGKKDELRIYYEMFGHQEGEYFGAAVTVGDVNGDGADDVIVGSPMYSTPNHYDVGCVHVYINNLGTKRNFESVMITPPSPTNGIRFGTAVSIIGDINKDGYSDLVIGSPYYNKGQGAIFIYLGSSSGISEQYSQKIFASDISTTLRGFGASFSRGVDIDNNKYNDFAVGSYLSSQVVVLKTRPVVTVRPLLKSERSQISINVDSFKISSCITYTGTDLPSTLKLKIVITADDFYKRVHFMNNRGTMLEIVKDFNSNNVETCEDYNVNVVNKHSDFTQPIVFKMSYELVESITNGFCATCPVVDKRLLNYTTLSIPYETGCGSDNICRPNLKLDAKFNYSGSYLVLGEQEKLDVFVNIRNFGDPAFACKFYAEIPLRTAFVKIPDMCQYVKDNVLLCDMGNPVKQNDVKSLVLPLDVSDLGNNDRLVVKLNVTSGGAEVDPTDNIITLEIPIKTQVRISVIGISNPEQFNFIEDDKLKRDNWTFNHEWTVQNLGPSPLNDLELTFWIPQSFGPDEANVVEVYKPEATADGTSIYCRSESREGFYVDPSDAPIIIEADPESRNYTLPLKARQTRSSNLSPSRSDENSAEDMTIPLDNPTIYTRVQKLIASDREMPEGLQENRTFALGCGEDSNMLCMKVVCNSGVLKKNSRAVVKFRLLADLKTLDQKREEKDTIVITSSVLPESQHFNVNKTYTHTLLTGNVRQESPLKWIILGLIFGIILLCLIIYGLYRAGFFRRKDHERLMNEKEGEETFGELTEQTED